MSDTTNATGPSVDEVSTLLAAMENGRLAAARFRQLLPGGEPVDQPTNYPKMAGDMRALLRSWTHFNDTTLVTLMQDLLRYYGQWDDDDHDAADKRRSNFRKGVAEDDLAYDGWSNEPQKRDLTAREREIIYRIIRDVLSTFKPYTSDDDDMAALVAEGEGCAAVTLGELNQLKEIQFVLYARHD